MLSLLLRSHRSQCAFRLGNAIEHSLTVCLDRGLQRQILAIGHCSATAPVKQGNVDLGADHGDAVRSGAVVASEVVGKQQGAGQRQSGVERRMRYPYLCRGLLHRGLGALNIGSAAQQVSRQHSHRLHAG